MINVNFEACDGPTLAGILTQSGGDIQAQSAVIDIFSQDTQKREGVSQPAWFYAYRTLPKDLKPKMAAILEELGLEIPKSGVVSDVAA